MTTKMIRLNQDLYKEMTFDEILEMYRALIIHYITKFKSLFPHHAIEDDDLYQEFSLALYKCYRLYDVSKGVGFGLVAKRYISHKSMNISRVNSAEKRRNKHYYELNIDVCYNLEDPNKTDDCLNSIVVDNYINRLSAKDRAVLKCKQDGLYVYEIRDKLHVSRQWIVFLTHKHKKNIKKELMLGGVNI